MNERSELNIELNAAAFRSFYYLKPELADFCRENGLPHRAVKQNCAPDIQILQNS